MSSCLGRESEFKEKNLVRVLGESVFRRGIGGCNIERQRVLRQKVSSEVWEVGSPLGLEIHLQKETYHWSLRKVRLSLEGGSGTRFHEEKTL